MTVRSQTNVLDRARSGDHDAFESLVAPFRRELQAHCYRMLGSLPDAEDSLQEALLGAWKGLGGFEGRSSVRTWLYRITTNACIRTGERRPARVVSMDVSPAFTDVYEVGEWSPEIPWLQPFPEHLVDAAAPSANPAARYEIRESVELAFVAALQHLPATQRAVLILRDVLAFPAAEVASLLDTSVAAANSALQRARATMSQRIGDRSQQATIAALGDRRLAEIVNRLVTAWERADVPALVEVLAEDVRFAMPPFPAWFDGRAAVMRFIGERVFATPWRMVPASANGQLAFACYQLRPGEPGEPGAVGETKFRLSAINVLTLRGDRVVEITGFLDRDVFARFPFPREYPG